MNLRLIDALGQSGVEVVHLTTFDVADDRDVVRIDGRSVERAACEMGARDVEAVFLSCTNLRTLDVIDRLAGLPVPVWSSNLLVARSLLAATDGALTAGVRSAS